MVYMVTCLPSFFVPSGPFPLGIYALFFTFPPLFIHVTLSVRVLVLGDAFFHFLCILALKTRLWAPYAYVATSYLGRLLPTPTYILFQYIFHVWLQRNCDKTSFVSLFASFYVSVQ